MTDEMFQDLWELAANRDPKGEVGAILIAVPNPVLSLVYTNPLQIILLTSSTGLHVDTCQSR